MKKGHVLILFLGTFCLSLISVINLYSHSAYASTKSYGYYKNISSDYMYNQAAKWWGENYGEGSEKNGSAVNAVAAAMSIFYSKKITPANIAKTSVENNIWDLKGVTPSDFINKIVATSDYGSSVPAKGAGKSVSARLSAIAKVFTKSSNSLVIARATGNNPFNTGESGGHYVLILAYKSDGKVYVYDPAQSNKSPKWIKGKTFLKAMKSNIYFWAIASGSSSSVETIDSFGVEPPSAPENEEADDDYYYGTEDWDEGWESMTPEEREEAERTARENYELYCEINNDCDDVLGDTCETDPENCTDDGSDGGSRGGSGGSEGSDDSTGTVTPRPSEDAQKIVNKALTAAWPVVTDSGAYCISAYSVKYDWDTQKDYCRSSIRNEYAKILERTGFGTGVQNARNSAILVASILLDSGVATSNDLPSDSLSQTTLYEYLEENAGNENSGWTKDIDSPIAGDIVYLDGRFFIYIGEQGGSYGNAISAIVGRWVPRIEDLTLTENYRIYRLGGNYGVAAPPASEGDESGEGVGLDDTIPEAEQTEGEQAVQDNAVGEKIAARAMSFSWPYTKYSTSDESLWGKCISKYPAKSKTTKSYPAASKASISTKELKTYPKGTSCNKTIPKAYANYLGISGDSNMNKGKIGALSFIKNVYASFSVNIHYSTISDLRSKLGDTSEWTLVSKDAGSAELQPGDLLVAEDDAMIYVGDFGQGYGSVVHAYYSKWVGRATPLYNKNTYVFRLKSNAQTSDNGDCPDNHVESVEGNDKIAVVAASMSWPYLTGKSDQLGKCLKGSKLVTYPTIYKISEANTKLTLKAKSTSALAKERKKTGCLGTFVNDYNLAASEIFGLNKKSDIGFVYTVMKTAGVKRFESTTNVDGLKTSDTFANLQHDTTNWELVTNKLTSKNKDQLKPGDIIIASQTKKKKTYSKIMIYIGKYGNDCTGNKYGVVVDTNSDQAPFVRPIYYNLNEDKKLMNFYVFRAKASAYEDPIVTPEPEPEPEPELPIGEDGETEPEVSTPTDGTSPYGEIIAKQAMRFSWPYNKYNTDNSALWGKCIYWWGGKNNTLVNYPKPFNNGNFSDQTNDWYTGVVKLKSPNNYYFSCSNTIPPYYAKYKNLKSWKITDIIDEGGTYAANLIFEGKQNKVMFTSPSQIKNGWDCINFVNDTLSAAGVPKFSGSPNGAINNTPTGWKMIGTSYSSTKSEYKSSTVYAIAEDGTKTKMEPGDVIMAYDRMASGGKSVKVWDGSKTVTIKVSGRHTLVWLGQMGWPYGDRAEGSSGNYSGGLIMDSWINTSDAHVYGSGNGQVFRYYGN